ncbi:MAG: hypothetical protein OSA93_05045 [Akkermansiaceae bacterium]|nr:hypothetical protein [Akkermansiaceae bacterium]
MGCRTGRKPQINNVPFSKCTPAGGGVKKSFNYGATAELELSAVENRVLAHR